VNAEQLYFLGYIKPQSVGKSIDVSEKHITSPSSFLKMEAICFSKMLVEFQQSTRRYFPEDRNFHKHCCGNLRFYDTNTVYERCIHTYIKEGNKIIATVIYGLVPRHLENVKKH
jgi:hypothetical protein